MSIKMRRDGGVIGWDVGGANLKAVRVQGERVSCGIWQTPLWRQPDLAGTIAAAVAAARKELGDGRRHLVAFSGESADCFGDRASGVAFLAKQMRDCLGTAVSFYGLGGITTDFAAEPLQLAAGNWHAAATALVAVGEGGGLWVDIGTTTADIVPLTEPVAADDDFARLQKRTLVYRGIVRTPIMAVAAEVTVGGRVLPLVAENFADMGDVYCLLGRELGGEIGGNIEGADGEPRTALASARRLLRMVGRDYDRSLKDFCLRLADVLRRRFEGQITAHFPRNGRMGGRIITSGVGGFIAADWARDNRIESRLAAEVLFPQLSPRAQAVEVSKCAPAAALAWLAMR